MFVFRAQILEQEMRNPYSICNVDCLLDTVTALVNDCDHESLKRLKNIEAYATKCKWYIYVYVDLVYYYRLNVDYFCDYLKSSKF